MPKAPSTPSDDDRPFDRFYKIELRKQQGSKVRREVIETRFCNAEGLKFTIESALAQYEVQTAVLSVCEISQQEFSDFRALPGVIRIFDTAPD